MSNLNNQYHQNNGLKQPQVIVVIVPFPAQGHLNQLLHLSRLISSYHIPVHFIGSSIHTRQAKLRVHGWDPTIVSNIHFHELPTPPFHSPPPNPKAPIKFPSHLQPSFDASSQLRVPVGTLLHSLSPISRRLIVIHDSIMASVVQDVASIPNAESYSFHSVSAFTTFLYLWEAKDKPFAIEREMLQDLPSLEGCFTSEFRQFLNNQLQHTNYDSSGNLYNTSKVFEAPYLNLLAKEEITGNKKHWAIGPFNPVAIHDNQCCNSRPKCLEWLDKQALKSVIYVSFGTTTCLLEEQITELAVGLDQSRQKFIWVLRDADKGNVFDGDVRRVELPKGYEERVEGRGLVLREWAPQLEILKHPSTGGFLSHCGWNSCIESISMGVPILTWPMHSDQPRNAMLITKLLKVGLVLKDWGQRHRLVKSSMIEHTLKRLMGSEDGTKIKQRAEELGNEVRQSVGKGGLSNLELESFVDYITR